MQENHRNEYDDSDVVETSEPFTITLAALNRHTFVRELQLAGAKASESTGCSFLSHS